MPDAGPASAYTPTPGPDLSMGPEYYGEGWIHYNGFLGYYVNTLPVFVLKADSTFQYTARQDSGGDSP
jgi:hypothetical protein